MFRVTLLCVLSLLALPSFATGWPQISFKVQTQPGCETITDAKQSDMAGWVKESLLKWDKTEPLPDVAENLGILFITHCSVAPSTFKDGRADGMISISYYVLLPGRYGREPIDHLVYADTTSRGFNQLTRDQRTLLLKRELEAASTSYLFKMFFKKNKIQLWPSLFSHVGFDEQNSREATEKRRAEKAQK